MILVAGGTGRLGSLVAEELIAAGEDVRIMARHPEEARTRFPAAEVVPGDVRDPDAVMAAVEGTHSVISAVHGLTGKGKDNPVTVDAEGNRQLMEAARRAGVGHFVLISMHGAGADHPMELGRAKHAAEVSLRASGLPFTIVRPTAFAELWIGLVGGPLLKGRKAQIFGRGLNPVNFVSVHDVADLVVKASRDPGGSPAPLDIGGPENITLVDLVDLLADTWGKDSRVKHVPVPAMRAASVLLRPFKPDIARLIRMSIVMDTVDMTFDAADATTGRRTLRECAAQYVSAG